jgi:hypothetical protein
MPCQNRAPAPATEQRAPEHAIDVEGGEELPQMVLFEQDREPAAIDERRHRQKSWNAWKAWAKLEEMD